MGEGAPLSWRPSAVADAGNGSDGPPPTPSRQGRSGGTVWRDSRSPCLSSPHPTLPPPGGKGQYFAGVLGMTAPVDTERYKHHRFPGAIISHGVWLSYRFTLSYESIQKLGAAAGLQGRAGRAARGGCWEVGRGDGATRLCAWPLRSAKPCMRRMPGPRRLIVRGLFHHAWLPVTAEQFPCHRSMKAGLIVRA